MFSPFMDFNFDNKSLVCKFNSYIIKSQDRNLEIQPINLKLTSEHLLLHKEVRSSSYMTGIFKEPKRVLKNKNIKENLKTYVSIVSKGKITFQNVYDEENKFLLGLLKFKRKYWEELLNKDIHAFIYLSKFLKFKAYEKWKLSDKQYEIIRLRKDIQKDSAILREIIKKNTQLVIPILSHVDCCVINKVEDPLPMIDKEYERMLNFILFDQKFKIEQIKINSKFYKEVDVFNKYLRGEEQEIIDKEFKTINERGVRDFVKDSKEWD